MSPVIGAISARVSDDPASRPVQSNEHKLNANEEERAVDVALAGAAVVTIFAALLSGPANAAGYWKSAVVSSVTRSYSRNNDLLGAGARQSRTALFRHNQ